jgi:membrane-associated protein
MPSLIDLFLHLDKHLAALVQTAGSWTYGVLFLIIFCETGLVVTPILPGDSLLFAAGAIAAIGSLNIFLLMGLLIIAAILGDAVNYSIGKRLGMKVFENKNSKIFKQEYLEKTQKFYDRYGGKTIIIARFVPIVRTFAPFLAGVGDMPYSKFAMYNISGAILWITSMTYAGYVFGGIEIIQKNFSLVVIGIVILSIMPAVIEYFRSRKAEA